MSKKKRTKEEKMKAQNRRIAPLESTEFQAPVYSIQHDSSHTFRKTIISQTSTQSHAYVIHDMRQTLAVVSILLGLNFLLFVLQMSNILRLPFLGA